MSHVSNCQSDNESIISIKNGGKQELYHCNDCNTDFYGSLLPNPKSETIQHHCEKYGKIIARKIGIKSIKCEADHDGACILKSINQDSLNNNNNEQTQETDKELNNSEEKEMEVLITPTTLLKTTNFQQY